MRAANAPSREWIDRIFRMLWRWCRRRHRQKTRKWIKEKYFKRFGDRDWVFTGTIRDGKAGTRPICLMEAARVRILRHVKIRSEANPYDPAWEGYFEERLYWKMEATLAGRGRIEYLWKGARGTMRGVRATAAGGRNRGRSITG